MAIAFPYQNIPPAQATPIGPQAPIPQVQPQAVPQQQAGPDAFELMLQKIQGSSPEERNALADQMVAQGNPPPPVPNTTPQLPNAHLDLQGANEPRSEPSSYDPKSGWLQFIDSLVDPEGASRFLLETSANILQPRPEQVSGASHVTSGLADSVGRLGQRRTAQAQARSQRDLEAAKGRELDARTGLYGSQAATAAEELKLIPSQIQLNMAKAWAEYQTGKAAGKPAAMVQLNNQIAEAIMAIAPDVHDKNTAVLMAQQMTKGDMSRSSFKENFGTMMAIFGSPGDISAMGEALADGLGLQDAPTLETIQQQQAEAMKQKSYTVTLEQAREAPETAFTYIKERYPELTDVELERRIRLVHPSWTGRVVKGKIVAAETETIVEEAAPAADTASTQSATPTPSSRPGAGSTNVGNKPTPRPLSRRP